MYGKLEDQNEKMQGSLRKYEREHKEHVEEIEMLQIKLEESEKREKKLIAEKNKAQKYNVEFQKRIEKIKRDSEEGIRKVIEVSDTK